MGYHFFPRAALALLVHELERLKLRIVEMVENREHFDFDDLWWPDLWPDLKNERNTFLLILDELSNAACRMSLRSSGAELDGGGVKTPPPPQHSMENPDHQHGEG